MNNKSRIKRGDVLLCESGFPNKENIVINFSHYDNGYIIDINDKDYRISDLKNMYGQIYIMR